MVRPWRGRYAVRFHRWMLNGHPGTITPACKRFIVRATRAGLVVTSTTDGSHATASFHFTDPGQAVDVGLPAALVGTATGQRRLARFQRREARHPSRFNELFGPLNSRCVKNGRPLTLAEGTALENLHDNHVHGALK